MIENRWEESFVLGMCDKALFLNNSVHVYVEITCTQGAILYGYYSEVG